MYVVTQIQLLGQFQKKKSNYYAWTIFFLEQRKRTACHIKKKKITSEGQESTPNTGEKGSRTPQTPTVQELL